MASASTRQSWRRWAATREVARDGGRCLGWRCTWTHGGNGELRGKHLVHTGCTQRPCIRNFDVRHVSTNKHLTHAARKTMDENLEAGAKHMRGKRVHAVGLVKPDTWQLSMACMHGGMVDSMHRFFFSELRGLSTMLRLGRGLRAWREDDQRDMASLIDSGSTCGHTMVCGVRHADDWMSRIRGLAPTC